MRCGGPGEAERRGEEAAGEGRVAKTWGGGRRGRGKGSRCCGDLPCRSGHQDVGQQDGSLGIVGTCPWGDGWHGVQLGGKAQGRDRDRPVGGRHCTCNNKLWAQGLTAGPGPNWSYSPRGRPWWLGAWETPPG